jgi:hypothetical protein
MEIKTIAFLAFYLIALDMVVGVLAAFACREFKSARMRIKWVTKITWYSVAASLGVVVTVTTGYYQAEGLCFTGILLTEALSLIEKMVKMQSIAGVNFGPLNKAIAAMAPYFDLTMPGTQPGQTVMTHVSVISSNPDEPEIHTTEVDTTPLRRPKAIIKPTGESNQ